uniref:Phosphatidylinositol-glycan biosynthesis class X protein n=1 Tax=Neogobius melanostomus TaxID=47308 RepID=A0A8C6TPY3_9GOBI
MLLIKRMLVYLLLFSTFAYLLESHSTNNDDASNDCRFLEHVNSDVSLTLLKTGFHRELVTTVQFNTHGFLGKLLLVYSWPKDIYVDPYQLVSLGEQRNWEMLLDSTIDLEMPAHKSSGFHTYLYPHLEELTAEQINLTVPIHGRYQKPSFNGNAFESVIIHPPDLLLRPVKNCIQPQKLESYTMVDAPCTANNSSTCQWIKVNHQKLPGPVTLQFPVGDVSLVIPVSGGTLLVTIICCVVLSISAWRRQIM